MIVRKSQERGSFDHRWLKTFHTFSFGQYFDPDFTGYSVLRVINEDRIRGGRGFAMHGHEDMEIITYIIDGAVEHKDNMGEATVVRAGQVQRMTAGTGVRHSETNHLPDRETHLLQIWIMPQVNSLEPSYEQKDFSKSRENLYLIVSRDGREGSVSIHQDVDIYVGRVQDTPLILQLPLLSSRQGWVQMVNGKVKLTANGKDSVKIQAGDGVAIDGANEVKAHCEPNTHFLFFDLP